MWLQKNSKPECVINPHEIHYTVWLKFAHMKIFLSALREIIQDNLNKTICTLQLWRPGMLVLIGSISWLYCQALPAPTCAWDVCLYGDFTCVAAHSRLIKISTVHVKMYSQIQYHQGKLVVRSIFSMCNIINTCATFDSWDRDLAMTWNMLAAISKMANSLESYTFIYSFYYNPPIV